MITFITVNKIISTVFVCLVDVYVPYHHTYKR